MKLTVKSIAERLGGALSGDDTTAITGVAGIREALPGQATYHVAGRYVEAISVTRASLVIAAQEWQGECPCAVIRVADPQAAFSELAAWFAPPGVEYAPGIHPTALIDASAELGEGVHVGPYCILGPDVKLGARTVLCGLVYLGPGVSIGADGMLYSHVSVREYTTIGERVIIHAGAVIGSDGFGYNPCGETWQKIPQIGTVRIGDRVEIGANVAIDRARFGQTVIGSGTKIDNLVQIAHNVQVGENTVMAGQAGISGSTIIGRHVQIAGQAGAAGHLTIGDNATIGGKSGLMNDVPAGAFVIGSPALPKVEYGRWYANTSRIPELKQRVKALEKRLDEIQKQPREDRSGSG